MSLSNPLPEPTRKTPPASNLAVYSVGAQIGCATLLIVLVSLFIGIGLDTLLHTKPVFIIIFVFGSAPLSLFLTYRLALRAVKNVTPNHPAVSQSKPAEEEDRRD